MEPKSIAFYTAVAIGMLAVLGATIFPALVQAVQAATTPLTATNGSGGSDGGGAANDNGQPQKDKTTDPKKSSSSDGGGAANDNGQPQKDKTTDPKSSTTSQNDNSAQGNDNHQNEVSNGNRATSQGLTLDPSGGRVSCGSVLTESTTL